MKNNQNMKVVDISYLDDLKKKSSPHDILKSCRKSFYLNKSTFGDKAWPMPNNMNKYSL